MRGGVVLFVIGAAINIIDGVTAKGSGNGGVFYGATGIVSKLLNEAHPPNIGLVAMSVGLLIITAKGTR